MKQSALKVTVAIACIVLAAFGLVEVSSALAGSDNWKQYRSEAGGFEVSYTDDWTVSTQTRENSLVVYFASPTVFDEDVFRGVRIMFCSTPVDRIAWNDCTERDSHLSEMYKDLVRSRKELVINGVKLERLETASKHDSSFFYYARTSANGRRFFVRAGFSKSFEMDRHAPVFDKMLNSFHLLGEVFQQNSRPISPACPCAMSPACFFGKASLRLLCSAPSSWRKPTLRKRRSTFRFSICRRQS